MAAADSEVRLVETAVTPQRHICAFFHNQEEKRRTILPFLREGLSQGDKIVRIVHSSEREEIRRRLRDEGIDVDGAEKRGQLEVKPWKIDLQGGKFEDGALEVIENTLATAHQQGYAQARIFGDWALQEQVYMEEFISLEARINTTLSKYGDLIVCMYDLSRVSGSAVLSAMRTHPIAIIGGILQQNPFYVPPEQIMEEIRKRGEPGAGVFL